MQEQIDAATALAADFKLFKLAIAILPVADPGGFDAERDADWNVLVAEPELEVVRVVIARVVNVAVDETLDIVVRIVERAARGTFEGASFEVTLFGTSRFGNS